MVAKVTGGTVLIVLAFFFSVGTLLPSWTTLKSEEHTYNGGVRDDVPFNVTSIRWSVMGTVSLTVCSDVNFTEEKNVTNVFLTYNPTSRVQETNEDILGVLDQSGKCGIFDGLPLDFRLPTSSTIYIVRVDYDDGSSKSGAATLSLTVETTRLECPGSVFTKVHWTDNSTELINPNCTEEPISIDSICFHAGDLNNEEFCFVQPKEVPVGENITICLDGPTDHAAFLSQDGRFSVSYLQYGDWPSVSPSFTLGPDGTTTNAVIVMTDDGSTAHSCSDNSCQLPARFTPSATRYRVCGELDTRQTAVAEFNDMQVTLFERTSPILQFVFVNELPNKTYVASVWQSFPPSKDTAQATVAIDCSRVDAGNACFGILDDLGELTGEAYLGVASSVDLTNLVIVSFDTSIKQVTNKIEFETASELTTKNMQVKMIDLY